MGDAAFDVDRDGVVCVSYVCELTVDQRFIQVEDQGLAATNVLWLWTQEASPEPNLFPTWQDLAILLQNKKLKVKRLKKTDETNACQFDFSS